MRRYAVKTDRDSRIIAVRADRYEITPEGVLNFYCYHDAEERATASWAAGDWRSVEEVG